MFTYACLASLDAWFSVYVGVPSSRFVPPLHSAWGSLPSFSTCLTDARTSQPPPHPKKPRYVLFLSLRFTWFLFASSAAVRLCVACLSPQFCSFSLPHPPAKTRCVFPFFSVERERRASRPLARFLPQRFGKRIGTCVFFCSLMYWHACVRGVLVSVSFSFLCVWVGGGGDLCFHNPTDRRTPLDLAKGMREKNGEPTERCVKVGRVPVGTRREEAHPYVHRGRRLLQLTVPGRGLECCLSLSWCASRFYRI